ncbi:MAG: EF-P beta-lysylation protein EpmB [Gammaproteobacteria bacterium]
MIARTQAMFESGDWRDEFANAVSDPKELLELLELSNTSLAAAVLSAPAFRLRVPRGFIARMCKGNPKDPLLLQVLPLQAEQYKVPGYGPDPVGDLRAETVPGVLHKYHGRALLVATGACAVHCRYCFRRHFPYSASNPAADGWRQALEYIRADPSIREVLLSGGDPLSLPDSRLGELAQCIAGIAHVRRLRVHSRVPIVVPKRVNRALITWLTATRLSAVLVVHANHANEIDDEVRAAMHELAKTGVTVLNQSVLLRGINDSPEALALLSERLFEARVLPYYLHLLDPVQGAAHFAVDRAVAVRLQRDLSALLPGYLVPKLVWEEAGAAYKQPLVA